jgi:hypothetical protein
MYCYDTLVAILSGRTPKPGDRDKCASKDVSGRAGESVPVSQKVGDPEAEGHQPAGYEPEPEGYGSLAEDHELPPNPTEGWGHEDELAAGGARAGVLFIPRVPLLASHRGSQPDLILRWNVSSVPEVIDVVVHLHVSVVT